MRRLTAHLGHLKNINEPGNTTFMKDNHPEAGTETETNIDTLNDTKRRPQF